MTQLLPTHQCMTCAALWRQCDDFSWNLRSPHCGPCCDNVPMGDQIVPLKAAAVQGGLTDARAAFEAWIKRDGGDLRTFGSGKNIHYSNSAVNNAWSGWIAAINTKKAALSANAGSQQSEPSEFWQWLPKAYRDSDANTSFTAYNMEVAFEAGRKLSSATPKEAGSQPTDLFADKRPLHKQLAEVRRRESPSAELLNTVISQPTAAGAAWKITAPNSGYIWFTEDPAEVERFRLPGQGHKIEPYAALAAPADGKGAAS